MEYARNVAGLKDAGHLAYDPKASTPLIVPASHPVPERPQGTPGLSGKLKIKVSPDSLAFRIYHHHEVEEAFHCNYELNPDFHGVIERNGMRITGVGEYGEARIIELPDHRFFLATLFQPQLTSQAEQPHPLVTAFLEAAVKFGEQGVKDTEN